MTKLNLVGLSRNDLNRFVFEMGEKPFRASQLWSWIYQKRLTDFEDMTNIAKPTRVRLDRIATVGRLQQKEVKQSAISNTKKYVWKLDDGCLIESVYIPEGKRRTICISTQVGCALGCAFCATGKMGFKRNLTVFEIVAQVLGIVDAVQETPTNIVVMGMGEPFLNYNAVIQALDIINDCNGLAIGHRKITISTAGIIPELRRYIDENHPYQLAVSLNAATGSLRSKLMPVNKKYPLKDLLQAVREYSRKNRKRVTFEYVLLKGVNDSIENAKRILELLKGIPCKVNLIAYNATCNRFVKPEEERIHTFAEWIRPLCAPVTLRLSRGDDINGACGQLAIHN